METFQRQFSVYKKKKKIKWKSNLSISREYVNKAKIKFQNMYAQIKSKRQKL